jgi:hypothetical protein
MRQAQQQEGPAAALEHGAAAAGYILDLTTAHLAQVCLAAGLCITRHSAACGSCPAPASSKRSRC